MGECCGKAMTPRSCPPPDRIQKLEQIGYMREEICELPACVTSSSAGCGNPLAFAEVKEGDTVLDLGSGVGMDCFLAAKRVGSGGKVIGVSRSGEHIAAANENKQKLGAVNVEFRQGPLEKMPVEDDSVDVAISNCVAIVMRGEGRVAREAFRVLRPGGRLLTTGQVEELLDPLRAAGFEQIETPFSGIVRARKPPVRQARKRV
jgi:SAM-dependent methyltransferase